MNKTDRMLAIVLELQRKGLMRAEDLAAIYETSVRTIYRDIQALSESGVPVVGAPGVGYSLVDGYFLPPVNFTEEEAVAMLIGADFIEQKFDAAYGAKAKSAQKKIEAILPQPVRADVARIRSTMKLIAANGWDTANEEAAFLETLRRALLERKKVRFHYQKKMQEADGNRRSTRVVAPYGLVLVHGSWALVAHCDLRHDIRHFRLSRMKGLTLLEESYTLPDNFQLQHYRPPDNRNTVVRILADASIRDKIEDSKNFFMEAIEEHPEGLLLRFRVNHPDELLSWVLGWGSAVTVLEPDSLRIRVREEVHKMLKRY
ncbi:helix-turn-helix transcriptional regulator [Brevibacillus panacihumi]|uniref:YafY family transcriptional regulator n=1 Tax=Brevibacillus panacihumi TaxID=497735 RepID=A0A3M8CFB0_9BACL|nr:YafY family protein [Brevibacillus panacihumi]RNB74434.1 YafY family transcriptional regulator [Brevibacillus panacihumi]